MPFDGIRGFLRSLKQEIQDAQASRATDDEQADEELGLVEQGNNKTGGAAGTSSSSPVTDTSKVASDEGSGRNDGESSADSVTDREAMRKNKAFGVGQDIPDEVVDEKVHPDDDSLNLEGVSVPRANKKRIKGIFIAIGMLAAVGFFFAMNESEAGGGGGEEEVASLFGVRIPDWLLVNDGDFFRDRGEEDEQVEEVPERVAQQFNASGGSDGTSSGNESPYSSGGERYRPTPAAYRTNEESAQPPAIQERFPARSNNNEQPAPPTSQPAPSQQPSSPRSRSRSTSYSGGGGNDFSPFEQGRASELFYAGVQTREPVSTGQGDTNNAQVRIAEAQARTAEAQRLTDYEKQNQQDYKQDFLESVAADSSDAYLVSEYVEPVEPDRELKAGTIIPITLITGVNTDLPGDIIAQVLVDVYDTVTGRNLLIPRGTRVYGSYSSAISFGQDRMLLAWERLIWPNGDSIALQGMQGVDNTGASGMAGDLDMHFDRIFAGVALSSGFKIAQNGIVAAMSTTPFFRRLAELMEADSQSETIDQITQEYAQRWIDRQPTITVPAGSRGNIMVNQDMVLPVYGGQW